MQLYIMRHGETDWNRQGRLQGSVDIPLNDYGIQLAKQTRDGFRRDGIVFDAIFTSPYQRARLTAEIIAGDGPAPVRVSQRVREMSFGSYEGIKVAELRTNPAYREINKCFDDPVHYRPQGSAESYEEVFERIRRFLEEEILPLEGSHEHVLVVCHGAVVRAFLCIIKHMELKDYWTMEQPNCSVNIARVQDHRITMQEEHRLYYQQETAGGGKGSAERRFV